MQGGHPTRHCGIRRQQQQQQEAECRHRSGAARWCPQHRCCLREGRLRTNGTGRACLALRHAALARTRHLHHQDLPIPRLRQLPMGPQTVIRQGQRLEAKGKSLPIRRNLPHLPGLLQTRQIGSTIVGSQVHLRKRRRRHHHRIRKQHQQCHRNMERLSQELGHRQTQSRRLRYGALRCHHATHSERQKLCGSRRNEGCHSDHERLHWHGISLCAVFGYDEEDKCTEITNMQLPILSQSSIDVPRDQRLYHRFEGLEQDRFQNVVDVAREDASVIGKSQATQGSS
mmetsp:Transcript_20750/g.59155  ORF Transcript_20750/g.59155 Transcript_20750/m.59155 type:complete len:285 (-) Transcript_20750:722-1576(-)